MNTTTRARVPMPPQEGVPVHDLPLATPMPDTTHRVVAVHQPAQKMYPPKIAAALLKITREINKVEKRGNNTFHNYKYPKWEDVLAELGPKMTEHGIIITQHEIQASGLKENMLAITYQFTIINEDGDMWPDRIEQTAICKMQDHKGVLDDKAASKCHTQGQKYFLMGLFKVRTRDMGEADHDANKPAGAKRAVPSPDGKVPPHEIATVEGDTAATWSARFLAKIEAAETEAEIGKWDQANDAHITRLMEMTPAVYNKVVEAIEARKAALANPAPKQNTAASSEKPKRVRKPPAPKDTAKPALSEDDRDFVEGLKSAYSGCEDMQTLEEEHARLATPFRDKVSDAAWNEAMTLYDENANRILGEG